MSRRTAPTRCSRPRSTTTRPTNMTSRPACRRGARSGRLRPNRSSWPPRPRQASPWASAPRSGLGLVVRRRRPRRGQRRWRCKLRPRPARGAARLVLAALLAVMAAGHARRGAALRSRFRGQWHRSAARRRAQCHSHGAGLGALIVVVRRLALPSCWTRDSAMLESAWFACNPRRPAAGMDAAGRASGFFIAARR